MRILILFCFVSARCVQTAGLNVWLGRCAQASALERQGSECEKHDMHDAQRV
jgi:hypothetical protein